ncbi:MAG: hypothetical protein KAY37_01310 [Phycisphaerae bacterium]|nr:hypothetical protein [Phycisphaerae bacterium]
MIRLRTVLLAALIGVLLGGCPNITQPAGEQGTTTNSGTVSNGDVSGVALSYDGSVSGSAATTSSTDAQSAAQSARKFAPRSQGSGGTAWLTDLEGNPLLDAQGIEYPAFPIAADGSFELGELPVGVDIMLNVDLDGNGVVDLQTIIHIPQAAGGTGGALDETIIDPLSTLTVAQLEAILVALGVDPNELGISSSALIGQIRDAFEHLFEDAGILQEINFDDIAGLSLEELAALFAQLIPEGAQRGMNMAHNSIALTVSENVEEVAKAAARILLEGGMAIADEPGGVDLSELGRLPNVETKTFDEFFMSEGMGPGGPGPGPKDGMPPEGGEEPPLLEYAQAIPEVEMVLYVNTAAEVDRNFPEEDGMGHMSGPMISEYVLLQMAEAHLAGKTISLNDLHTILTDPEKGLGLRLTYPKMTDMLGPPIDVFESADGQGIEKNIFTLMDEIMNMGMFDPSPEAWERHEAEVRAKMVAFLEGTVAPSLERLLEGVLMERVPSIDEFARILRDQRIHIPWSRSGPSLLHVVATDDSFMHPTAAAVRVNAVTDEKGKVLTVTYNAAGEFYLGFGPPTENGHLVELIRTTNGRSLHDHHGMMQQLDLADGSIFTPIGGVSFYEIFSETHMEWPVAPDLFIVNPDFDPSLPPDPETNPPDFQAMVLMSGYEPGSTPVQVSYDSATGKVAVEGDYYLMADENHWEDGLFALISGTGDLVEEKPGVYESRVRVDPVTVAGLNFKMQVFTWIYGIDVPNPGYDPAGAPYWDDINGNGVEDNGEPTFSEQHFLFDPNDWRSTFVEQYYRRADNLGFPDPMQIDWMSETPRMMDGTALVPRYFRPRLNGFRFGRPNLTINLLAAFAPPEFFNGTQALNGATRVNPFMTMALVNLIMESTHCVEALLDFDGPGPQPERMELVPAHFFMPPVGDPVQLLADGFKTLTMTP